MMAIYTTLAVLPTYLFKQSSLNITKGESCLQSPGISHTFNKMLNVPMQYVHTLIYRLTTLMPSLYQQTTTANNRTDLSSDRTSALMEAI